MKKFFVLGVAVLAIAAIGVLALRQNIDSKISDPKSGEPLAVASDSASRDLASTTQAEPQTAPSSIDQAEASAPLRKPLAASEAEIAAAEAKVLREIDEEEKKRPTAEVEDKISKIFPDSKTIAEETLPEDSDGYAKKFKLLATDFHDSKILIKEERLNGKLVRQEMMVADQLLVSLKPGTNLSAFESRLRTIGSRILQKLNDQSVLVQVPQSKDLQALDRFREKLSNDPDIKYRPDPNHVRTVI